MSALCSLSVHSVPCTHDLPHTCKTKASFESCPGLSPVTCVTPFSSQFSHRPAQRSHLAGPGPPWTVELRNALQWVILYCKLDGALVPRYLLKRYSGCFREGVFWMRLIVTPVGFEESSRLLVRGRASWNQLKTSTSCPCLCLLISSLTSEGPTMALDQRLPIGAILSPGDIWQSLETFLVITLGNEWCDWHLVGTGQECGGHPAVPRTAPQPPLTETHLVSNVHSAETEKLRSR